MNRFETILAFSLSLNYNHCLEKSGYRLLRKGRNNYSRSITLHKPSLTCRISKQENFPNKRKFLTVIDKSNNQYRIIKNWNSVDQVIRNLNSVVSLEHGRKENFFPGGQYQTVSFIFTNSFPILFVFSISAQTSKEDPYENNIHIDLLCYTCNCLKGKYLQFCLLIYLYCLYNVCLDSFITDLHTFKLLQS